MTVLGLLATALMQFAPVLPVASWKNLVVTQRPYDRTEFFHAITSCLLQPSHISLKMRRRFQLAV